MSKPKKKNGRVNTPIGEYVDPKQQGFFKSDSGKVNIQDAKDPSAYSRGGKVNTPIGEYVDPKQQGYFKPTNGKVNIKDALDPSEFSRGGKINTSVDEYVDPKQQGYFKPNNGKVNIQDALDPSAFSRGGSTKKNDAWKDELRQAYDTMARRQTEASDKQYDQAKTSADLQAASRGMGRSSYNNQVLAGLDSDKVRAQNTIRENVDAQYAQAVQQREDTLWQQHFQEQQAAQQQANWQAQFDFEMQKWKAAQEAAAAAGSSYTPSNPPPAQDDTGLTWADMLDNWRFKNELEKHKQNRYNTPGGKTTYSPTGLASVGLGSYATHLTK